MTMKKVLVLTSFYHPDLSAGSFRCLAFVEELSKFNLDIHVITTSPNRYDSFKVKAKNFESNKNIRINRVKVPAHKNGIFGQIKTFYSFYSEAKNISDNNSYDLVYATSSKLFTAFLGARVARKKNIPLYLDIRDLFIDTVSSIFPLKISFFINPFLRVIENYSFNTAKKINIVSKGFIKYFEEYHGEKSLSYYTNGIDSEFINKSVKSPVNKCTKKKIINILYAGNIGEGQGLHKIIPFIAKELEGKAHFKVIGAGGMRQDLIDKSIEFKLDNIEITEPIPRERLIKEYIKSDVLFLHLNNYDAFLKVLPSKLFEYASINRPILAGISGYSAEFARHEITDCSIFEPLNYKEAVTKIKSLNFDVSPRVSFIKKYSRESIMIKMAKDVYDQI